MTTNRFGAVGGVIVKMFDSPRERCLKLCKVNRVRMLDCNSNFTLGFT